MHLRGSRFPHGGWHARRTRRTGCLEPLETRVLLHGEAIKINFQIDSTIDEQAYPELTGYVADWGRSFGDRGNGLTFGWLNGQLNPDTQSQTRNRNNQDAQDERYDTLNHFIKGDNHSWQIELENGFYDVLIVAGDPSHTDQVNDIDVISGGNRVRLHDPDGQDHWDQFSVEAFQVVDRRLRLTPYQTGNGSNQKVAFVEITHRDDLAAMPPAVVNTPAASVAAFSASIGGTVTDDGNDPPQITVFYGANDGGQAVDSWDHSLALGVQSADFAAVVDALVPNTTYYYRGRAANSAGEAWAPNSAVFRTLPVNVASVTNHPAQDIESSAATLNGEVLSTGNDAPQITVYWGPTDGGTAVDQWANSESLGQHAAKFSTSVSSLMPDTTYYFRAHAANSAGSSWSSASTSFSTQVVTPATLGPTTVIDIEAFQALITGQVLDSGNQSPQIQVFWGESDAGSVAAAWANSMDLGPGGDLISATVTGLSDGTVYFYRIRAVNSAGTSWSANAQSFTTLTASEATVVHEAPGSITATTAELRGRVADTGNDEPLIEIFYGRSDGGTDEAAWENSAEVGFELGSFSLKIDRLQPEQQYFYRARAINSSGTSWANASGTIMTQAAPTLLITEFMAHNESSLNTRVRPARGAAYGNQMTPDWIELYNSSDDPVSLNGLYLTDDADQIQKWSFPNGMIVEGHAYLVVFASGEDIRDPALDERGYLHADFRLSGGGEYLALTSSDGMVHAYVPSYPEQLPDISYGIDSEGAPHFYSQATPGAENASAMINFVDDTKFSHDRGFYADSIDVEIRSDTPGATLVYTLDGSKPTQRNGTRVEAPNDQTAPVATVTVSTTTLLRAFALKAGFEPTDIDTHTYIFPEGVLSQATDPDTGRPITPAGFPTRWGSVTGDYQVDPDIVNHPNDDDRLSAADLSSVPSLSVVMDVDDLFGANQIYLSGSGSPRAASFELITADAGKDFQIDGSLQIQGGSSTNRWKDYKLSMRVKFQAPFGPSKLNHALYQDSPIEQHDNIILDGVLNHSWVHSGQHTMPQYIQDQYVADLHNAMEGYSPYGRFMNVYLNGLYWGMYYVHDRPDHAWAAQLFGGEKEEYHAVKHNGNTVINNGNGNSARSAYSAMVSAANAVQSDPDDLARWQTLQDNLDVDNFITYLLANWFTGNHDWPHKNWYATARDVGPWRFHSWDAEHVTDSNNDVGESPSDLHAKLDGNDEYLLRMADLIHKHFFNDGVLVPDSATAIWTDRMEEIDRAIVGESARWGDNRSSRAHTRSEWLSYNGETRGLIDRYFPKRTATVLNQLRDANIYPSLDAPEFNQHGGPIPAGFDLTIANPDNRGTIYWTTDGSDPRQPGGQVSGAAVVYDRALGLSGTTTIHARVLDGNTWSALTKATFYVSAPQAGDLVISEINYHPHPALLNHGEVNVAADEFEFIELRNVADYPINLKDVQFVSRVVDGRHEGIRFVFEDQLLDAGEPLVVVRNVTAFASRYGQEPRIALGTGAEGGSSGEYDGQLNNGGELLTLMGPTGGELLRLRFNDSNAWPGRADGGGSTLELISAAAEANTPGNWRSSGEWAGSPAASGEGPSDEIVLNELLTHTDLPQIDLLELHNTSGAAVDVGGWYVSDSSQNYFRYRIPGGTVIAAGSYLVLDETQLGFGFKGEQNDDAWLIAADATGKPVRFMDRVRFDASENGVALGRWPDGSGDLFPMADLTFGKQNAGPVQPMTLISEVHYHPPHVVPGNLTANDREFVEIWNIATTAIDIGHWLLDGAIEYELAAGTSLQPDTGLLVVGFDPSLESQKAAGFRQHFRVPNHVALVGPYNGVLDNGGEELRLVRPAELAQLGVGYVLVDRVRYDDQAPWPTAADGNGEALHRTQANAYGDFASSWQAAPPTAGLRPLADLPGDLNMDGQVNDVDVDTLCSLIHGGDERADLNGDGTVDDEDLSYLIRDRLGTNLGDANLDGVFNSSDLIAIFQAGEYEDGVAANSGWADGDWNCDGEFDSGDIIAAFQAGSYEAGANTALVDTILRDWSAHKHSSGF